MTQEQVLQDIALWSDKKAEICQNLHPMFGVVYSTVLESIEEQYGEGGSIYTKDKKSEILNDFVGTLMETYEDIADKDITYYTLIAVLHDCMEL